MAAYATVEQARALSLADDFEDLSDEQVTALLGRASRALDSYLGTPAPEDDELRIDTATVTDYQAARLAEATVSQAVWLAALEDDRDSLGVGNVVAIPGGITFSTNPLSFVAPAVPYLLDGVGLFRKDGTASPTPEPTG